MTRRNNRRNNNNRAGRRTAINSQRLLSGIDRTIAVPGKTLLTNTIPGLGTTAQIQVTASSSALGSRLNALGNVYEAFKFKQLSIRCHPAVNSLGVPIPYVVAYYKTQPSVAPTTLASAYEATCSRLVAAGDTVPQQLDIPSSALMSNVRPWYDTDQSTTDVDDYAQGYLYIVTPALATGVTAQFNIEVGYMCLFRGATNPIVD